LKSDRQSLLRTKKGVNRPICGLIDTDRCDCCAAWSSTSHAEGTILVLRFIHVGVGGWGLDWELNPIPRVKSAERVACVDASPAILAEAQKALGVDPSICYESLETALAKSKQMLCW
jgi:hypothetical protein